MNVDAFILADFVEPHVEGKLTIVGTFNRIVAPQVPYVVASMGLGIIIHAHASEAGTKHALEIQLLNGRREEVANIKGHFKFPDNAPAAGVPLRAVHAINIGGAPLPEFGPYAFELYVDGTYHAATVFVLEQAS